MKEFADKFNLNEFLSYLCPGVCLLLSLALWIRPNFTSVFGAELAAKEGIVVPAALILGYAAGLLVAAWSGHGAHVYLSGGPHGNWAVLFPIVWLLHSMPKRSARTQAFKSSLVQSNLRIAAGLRQYGGFRNLSGNESPWECVWIYRVLVAGRTGERGKPIVAEADSIHRHLLFALNMSLVLMLTSLQVLARLIFKAYPPACFPLLPPIPHALLYSLLLVPAAASASLRVVAARWRTREIILTGSLAPLVE